MGTIQLEIDALSNDSFVTDVLVTDTLDTDKLVTVHWYIVIHFAELYTDNLGTVHWNNRLCWIGHWSNEHWCIRTDSSDTGVLDTDRLDIMYYALGIMR